MAALNTAITASFYSLHQFLFFTNIFENLVSWFIKDVLIKMKDKCEIQCILKFFFLNSRCKVNTLILILNMKKKN